MPRTIKEQILYIIGTFFRSQGKFKREWSTAIRLSSKPFNDGIINIHVTMMQLPDNLTYIDTRSKEYSIQSERKRKLKGKSLCRAVNNEWKEVKNPAWANTVLMSPDSGHSVLF